MKKINYADALITLTKRRRVTQLAACKAEDGRILEENIKFRERIKEILNVFKDVAKRWPKKFEVDHLSPQALKEFQVPRLYADSKCFYVTYAEDYGTNPTKPNYILWGNVGTEPFKIAKGGNPETLIAVLLERLSRDESLKVD